MGLLKISWLLILSFWVFSFFCLKANSVSSEVSVIQFLKTPHAFSKRSSATFAFHALYCSNCSFTCKLDDGIASSCEARKASYLGLQDGNHTFEVCTNRLQGVGCASYNWTIDTVSPTANVSVLDSFTNDSNISVNISFSELCTGGGGFKCLSANDCNLLVYGAGQVIPSSLDVLQQNLKYSLAVNLSSNVQFGRVILVMDKNFCTDIAGNQFIRTSNSSINVHFDRRIVFANVRIRIPEKLLQIDGQTRTVQATNSYNNLKVYLYFSSPVLNSTQEILDSLTISQGTLVPTGRNSLGNRRFGFLVANVSSGSIVTVSLKSNPIISRQGTPVSPILPVTFLYDSKRPAVKLSTTSTTRTRERIIPISIKFMKPVFGFNSSNVSISGGNLQSFRQINWSAYYLEIHATNDVVSINVPENVTGDVSGNKNLASNVLQVKHYSVPMLSSVISAFVAATFAVTSLAAGILTFSTASIQTLWTYATPPLITDPTRNLFRIASHIQVFALSRWLAVALPVEYYEFVRSLEWSIPSNGLPWETGNSRPVMVGSTPLTSSSSYVSKMHGSEYFRSMHAEDVTNSVYGLPLLPMEYAMYFENHNIKPEAEYHLDLQNSNGWRDFSRSMFWLAVIGGSLILLHILVLLILKMRKKLYENKKHYGALTFPRFEIFLTFLSLPCICEASAALVRGREASGLIVGILLLTVVAFLLLALFLFLSIGITFGKLLQYKEVHQEGQTFHWYQELVRVTLGPGKRGQWTWKNQASSVYQIILGPLFEDLRGPPKYMLSQISRGNPYKPGDRIIASDDETEDAEAPFIQKLFGILRIYYTLLECLKRVSLGLMAGVYMENWTSKTPTITLLCITSFQLFFLVLKKPFIKKKVQLVEIISVSSEVILFAICVFLLKKELSDGDETKVGISMIIVFLIGYVSQMINELYALYRQTMLLDPTEKSFLTGLKVASVGCILLFIPQKLIKKLENRFKVNQTGSEQSGDRVSDRIRNPDAADKPWPKQLRELAKASFSKERSSTTPSDPSTSRAKWSGFWKRSGSSSLSLSDDSKSKPKDDSKSRPKGLYKDLEDIFASK